MPDAKRVLIVGENPDLVDFSAPNIPPGLDAAKIRAGLEVALARMRERGLEADVALTTTEEACADEVSAALRKKDYDCVVVGGGLRLLPTMTRILETVINVVHETAPRARIAFNTSPEDSVDAAERQLARGR